MTDGYKCDRCGKFESGPISRGGAFSTDYSEDKFRKITYGHRTGEDNSGGKTRHVDLCEDCRKAFTGWLNND